ncbi:hypothetical protein [Lentzea sp. NEAU-D7]|uniref:hypothetical protein n=1 Tax=Lentzea sp. NEAU-D7 TaxID=2994667 RepID=UPI00224B477F|nr:hypothetical protein [Lentzea sp. NEAU-D7]MCX2948803.1 hypothetical protein [Lentzea sp. NEAU-D7]
MEDSATDAGVPDPTGVVWQSEVDQSSIPKVIEQDELGVLNEKPGLNRLEYADHVKASSGADAGAPTIAVDAPT